jgi:hypothetical protein
MRLDHDSGSRIGDWPDASDSSGMAVHLADFETVGPIVIEGLIDKIRA